MKRTDTHRPSAINPQDYFFVSFHDHRADAAPALIAENQTFHAHMEKTGGKFSTHGHGGVCHVCGNANAMSVARFWHEPTNTYIEVGETCADKLLEGDRINFASFRKRVAAGVEAVAGKRKAQAALEDAGLSLAYEIFQQRDTASWAYEENIVYDIVQKLVRYGSISDKQQNFLRSLIHKIENREVIAAQRAAEYQEAKPIPAFDGRATIDGEVLSIKEAETIYGYTLKMVVKSPDGWKVYGSVPSGVALERGDKVSFNAMVTVSNDDPKFGFFKRPTKMQINGEPL